MVQRAEDKRVSVQQFDTFTKHEQSANMNNPKLGTQEPELGTCCPISQTWPPQGIETSADTWPYFPDELRTR